MGRGIGRSLTLQDSAAASVLGYKRQRSAVAVNRDRAVTPETAGILQSDSKTLDVAGRSHNDKALVSCVPPDLGLTPDTGT
jgi:hypothetical protein